MEKSQKLPDLPNRMSVLDAIYKRRAERDYTPESVSEVTIHSLLYAAIQAPTAMHEEPWAFAVIQDKNLLDRLSKTAMKKAREQLGTPSPKHYQHSAEIMADPDFNVFYNASSLIVIFGNPVGPFAAADCWLSAENMMLAAYAAGLGSCVIGLAVAALNTPEWKKALDIPSEMVAHAPILLGYPAGVTASTGRKAPEILCWKK